MRLSSGSVLFVFRLRAIVGVVMTGWSLVFLSWNSKAQDAPAQSAPVQQQEKAAEMKGMPPRAAPTDYQAQGKAGAVTVAAEFMGHSVPTPEATFSTEDYVVVETGIFGDAGAKLKLSVEDFSLRINGKKGSLASQPFGLVLRTLKDPEWQPPAPPESKSKTSFGSGGKDSSSPPPLPPRMPMPLQHAMEMKVQKASLPEGERPLPQAGLIYFLYHGKTQNLHSLELVYNGPAGSATLELHP